MVIYMCVLPRPVAVVYLLLSLVAHRVLLQGPKTIYDVLNIWEADSAN